MKLKRMELCPKLFIFVSYGRKRQGTNAKSHQANLKELPRKTQNVETTSLGAQILAQH